MWYQEDLAYIHDIGYGNHAIQSAAGILEILAQSGIQEGLIVDLGCGSGLSAREFVKASYRVLGVDISESMIQIARARVPEAEFRVESLFETEIPSCHAVTAIGECVNYLFDPNSDRGQFVRLCDRVYHALVPGGLFLFDIAEPGQVIADTPIQGFTEGKDWIVLVEKEEDRDRAILTRRIITFRKVGEYYRRDEEVHRQQLYKATDLAEELRRVGFHVRILRNYGRYELPIARAALIAQKKLD